jgi:hypothetical protein
MLFGEDGVLRIYFKMESDNQCSLASSSHAGLHPQSRGFAMQLVDGFPPEREQSGLSCE